MESNTKTVCPAHAETASAAFVVPDLHWCNAGIDGHAGIHRCSCGLEWAEEVPC